MEAANAAKGLTMLTRAQVGDSEEPLIRKTGRGAC